MATMLKKVNLDGDAVGEIQVVDALADATVSSQLVKDYIVALRANARQWSANTKGRSEVNHSTKKPHPQKGQGRSRQGSLAAPHYKGGGRVFGPKPKFDQHVRINQKEKRSVIRALLAEKMREGRFVILDSLQMAKPKTKRVNEFFNKVAGGRRVLLLAEGAYEEIEVEGKKQKVSVHTKAHENIRMSMRNIPGTEFRLACDVSGYDVMLANDIVVTESAMQELKEWLLREEQR